MTDTPDTTPRKWTVEDIGRALSTHIAQEKIMEANNEALSEKVNKIYKVLIEGNGEPSIREQVRSQQNWINSVNKLAWIFITALAGQIIVGGCSILIALIVLLGGVK